ncbi:MAG: plastocyanin/azurin family copper-binding protein [Nitrospinota bacterium]
MVSLIVIKVSNMKNIMSSALITLILSVILPYPLFGGEKVHVIDIPEGSVVFVPDVLTIEAGDTIRWTNHDHAKKSHNFASIPGAKPKNKEIPIVILKQDKTFEHTFNKPGEYRYFCYVHRGMMGKIIVKPGDKEETPTTEITEEEKTDN